MSKCKPGYYYCFTNKECKPIPPGFMIDPAGMLAKENGHTVDEACWVGYKQVGMKKKGKRIVPNCVKEEGLRDWFGKSKSKDGKSGWVNVVTGGTCASDEPGEGTPKCVSSAKRASMSDAERKSASRRKKLADPGQQSKSGAAKPTYVPTDSPKKKMNENHKAIASGKEKDEEGYMASTEMDTINSAVKKLRKNIKKGDTQLPAWVQSKITKAADYIDTAADYMDSNEVSEESDKKTKGSGTKDACYSKVKSRYSVWPSAYASGALVKCRKVGAANWGNKSESINLNSKDPLSEAIGTIRYCPKCKKDETKEECRYGPKYWDMFSIPSTLSTSQLTYDIGSPEPSESTYEAKEQEYSIEDSEISTIVAISKKLRNYGEVIDEKCWPGYKKKGMKTMFGKRYPNCVKKEEFSNWRKDFNLSEDWQSVNRKDKTDGLSQKAVNAYRRENPGSKLQTAVTEKNPSGKRANRRKNFCSRMSGMKAKLTSNKTARDPDSKINKALRRWNCN